MKSGNAWKIVFCAVFSILLSACQAHPPRSQVVIARDGFAPVPQKERILVVERFMASFGNNEHLFRDRLSTLAASCHLAIDFFQMPNVSGQLALDTPLSDTRSDLKRKLATFAPDGILDVRTLTWKAEGVLPTDTAAQLQKGNFTISLQLRDGKTTASQWLASAALRVFPDSGGDALAEEIVRMLSRAGALPNCPKSASS